MNKVHAVDPNPIHNNRTLCHTYRTSSREVIMTADPRAVTCTRCAAKLAKQAA
jgi:hypothetical protein